jgi:CRP-like cAMP-binding protein
MPKPHLHKLIIDPTLAANHLFASCSQTELAELTRLTTRLHVPQGITLIHQGTPSRQFFIIATGTVQIRRQGKSTIAKLGPEDYFGETGLLGNATRTASAFALTELDLYVTSSAEFRQMVRTSRPFALKVRLADSGARSPATVI